MNGISIMLLGANPFPLLSRLVNYDENIKHYIHCFNVLDYTIPTKEPKITSRFYRSELRRAFRLLKSLDTKVTTTHLELLRKHDFLDLDDIDLEINAWIQQVFDNKVTYDSTYKYLSGDLTKAHVELVPLIDEPFEIVVHKGTKISPLRYYYQKKSLLDRSSSDYFNRYEELHSEDLDISGHHALNDVTLNDESLHALGKSKFLVILASDLVSLGVFSKMSKVLEQVKHAPLPVILVIPETMESFENFAESDIFELLELGGSIDKMVDRLSLNIDYVFTPNSNTSLGNILLETGYTIQDNSVANPLIGKNTDFIEFLAGLSS